jgi:hypothetical protein
MKRDASAVKLIKNTYVDESARGGRNSSVMSGGRFPKITRDTIVFESILK